MQCGQSGFDRDGVRSYNVIEPVCKPRTRQSGTSKPSDHLPQQIARFGDGKSSRRRMNARGTGLLGQPCAAEYLVTARAHQL